jgi:hypothetical protein
MLGAREYVRKSFSGHALTEAIARVLGRGLAVDPVQPFDPPPAQAGPATAPRDGLRQMPAWRFNG